MTRAPAAAGWAVLLGLVLLGLGGAAARPGGLLLGLPSAASAALGLAAVAAVAVLARGDRSAPRSLLGFAPVPLLLAAGAPLPGLAALSGPSLLALALAGLALALAPSRRRLPRGAFLALALAGYALVAARGQAEVGPRGDEPHYLMVAESLLSDGDLALGKDYAERRYLAFHDAPLEPHYRVRGKGGEIYSLHAVGLSVLILPAYALGGYPAASLFMALLAALLAAEIRGLVREAFGREGLADGVGLAVALSPPLVHYAGLVFTEVPAALLVAVALRRIPRGHPLGVALALASLPWLNVRYVALAAVLAVYALWVRPGLRERLTLLGSLAVSGVGLAAYHHWLYGFFDPRRVYGRRPELSLATLPEGVPGLLLDQEFGLLVYAPLFLLGLPGFFQLWRKDRRQSAVLLALVAGVVLTAGTWHMWRGGFNPPARFLVPLLPALAVLVAASLQRGLGAGAALLVGWSLWVGLAGAAQPSLVHRDRDGTAPFFRAASGAEEWTRLLPGYVLADPDRHRLALVWGAALLLALPWRPRAATPRRVAMATLGLLAAAGSASALSHARTGGRDAVRLVGRPALAVPGWSFGRDRPATWGPEALDWGPLFEPHRHPGGAVLGSRLALPPGTYHLALRGESLAATPPGLEVHPDRPGAPWRPAEPGPEGWTFAVRPAERAVSLLLRGGGPFLLEGVVLQPSAPGTGPTLRRERSASGRPR